MRSQSEFDRICEDREKVIAAENSANNQEGVNLVRHFSWCYAELGCEKYHREGLNPKDELLMLRNRCYKKIKLQQDLAYFGFANGDRHA